jgi:alginate O-acetyltransferase complex protein AlgJ
VYQVIEIIFRAFHGQWAELACGPTAVYLPGLEGAKKTMLDRKNQSPNTANIQADFEGKLEQAGPGEIRGWIWDRRDNGPVFVSILIDGHPYCTVVADHHRADVAVAEKRGGSCGFGVNLPDAVADGNLHHIRAVVLLSNPEYIIGEISTKVPTARDKSQKSNFTQNAFYHNGKSADRLMSARALVGKRNWLFLADDGNQVRKQIAGTLNLPAHFVGDYVETFKRRKEVFEKLGIPYLFFIVPTKEIVCMDRLPYGLPASEEAMPSAQVAKAVSEMGFPLRHLGKVLYDEEKNGRTTFHRTDTHWNSNGAHKAYREIIRQASEYITIGDTLEENDFSRMTMLHWQGDLATKEKVSFLEIDRPYLPYSPTAFAADDFFEDVERLVDLSGDVMDGDIPEHLKVSETRPNILKRNKNTLLPKAIVFRDSFTNLLVPMLSRHFSESVFLWKPDIDFSLVERERPDIVIQVVIDRFMARPPKDTVGE